MRKKTKEKSIVEEINANRVLIPNQSMGRFTLNSPISSLDNLECVHTYEQEQSFETDNYEFSDGNIIISSYSNSGIIDSILVFDSVTWDGIELIGLNINTFEQHFKLSPDDCDGFYVKTPEDPTYMYIYYGVGLQICVNKSGCIESVMISSYDDD